MIFSSVLYSITFVVAATTATADTVLSVLLDDFNFGLNKKIDLIKLY